MIGLQTIQKYKETIIFVSCAAALVGTVLVLQKATTPSRHRRRAPSSASRAGTATARSASHGVAGTRSRSSSRPRTAHTDNHTQHHTGALSGPTLLSAKSDATAAAAERSHGARSRDVSQAHAHRHHTHSRTTGTGGSAAASTPAVAGGASGSCPEGATEAPAPRLTVEAVLQHKHALGTANALQDAGQADAAGERVARRVVSSSGCRVQGGSGTGEEGCYYRSASNAATVGSQAPCPPLAASAAALALSDGTAPAVPPASPRSTVPVTESPTSANGRTARAPAAVVPPSTALASATQTNPRWFCEDRGTQTEQRASPEPAHRTEAASATPERWVAAAMMMSPIMPTGDGNAHEDTSPINYADFGWTPLHDARTTEKKPNKGPRKSQSTGTPAQPDLEQAPAPAAPVIPRVFLLELEEQVRRLVEDVARAEWNEATWMRLYAYLAALPDVVRAQLAKRDRCGAATVARLVESRRSASQAAGNRVEGEAAALAEEKARDAEAPPSLGQVVLQLMHTGTSLNPGFHFEWHGQQVAYVEGAFDDAAARFAMEVTGQGSNGATPSRHPKCADGVVEAAATVEDCEAAEEGEEDAEPLPYDESARTAQLLAGVMAHIKKYAKVLQRPVPPPHRDPDETRTPPRTTQTLITTAPYALSTPPGYAKHGTDTAVAAQLQRQQEQLASLLQSFVQLRQTPLFQAVRHTPQHALFACDFIELAAAAERVLDRTSPSPDSTLLLQVPTTQKRVMADAAEGRDTSVDTVLSGASGSSPFLGTYAGRHSARVRTPMKPSIRYPIQRVLSNSPSPAGLSSRRDSEAPPATDAHCYPGLSSAHAGDRKSVRVGSIDPRRGSERPAELWAS